MKYISTRGDLKKMSFTEILLEGLAKDGGLYMPEKYPQFSKADLEKCKKMSYAELAFFIMKKFEVDISDVDLKKICQKSYTDKIFKYSREPRAAKAITPLLKLEDNLYIQELSNGPTLAFKDMAMQMLGNLFEYVLEKKNKNLNILGATSGDTGSAAEYAMLGKKRVNVFMLSPLGKMSAFQRAQMYSLMDKNIFNIAVNGMFDDAQDVVKEISMDANFKKKYNIGAVNSINWARILAQVVYYFNGYFLAADEIGERVDFVVPSGNFGNICAGHVARMCGLPIGNLILATNENNVLDEFFKIGLYRPRKSSETFITTSPSMDISKASNLERFLFDLVGRDGKVVNSLMQTLSKNGEINIASSKFWTELANYNFLSGSSSGKNRLQTIKKVLEKYNLFIDTHTADAFYVGEKLRNKKVKNIILETAQAVKFEETVLQATGKSVPAKADIKDLSKKMQKIFIANPEAEIIKGFIKSSVK